MIHTQLLVPYNPEESVILLGLVTVKHNARIGHPIILLVMVEARGVMVIVAGNGHSDTSSNLYEAVCISRNANILGKGINPFVLLPAIGK